MAEAQARLAAIVESSDDAIIAKSLDGTITSWNAAAERVFGYTEAEMVGRSILTIIPPELHSEEPQIIQRLTRGERIAHYETVRLRKDGTRFHVSLSISPVRDSSGRVVGAAKILHDITREKKAASGQQLLSDLATTLTSTLDFDVIADRVARLAVSGFADWCIVDLIVGDEGSSPRVVRRGAAHADPELQHVLDELTERYPPDIDRPTLAGPAVRRGKAIVVPDVPDDCIDEFARDAGHAALTRRLGLRSYIVAPLATRGRIFGVVAFLSATARYDTSDLPLAEEVARRTALALENARLFRDIERRENEQRLIADAGAILSSSRNHAATLAALTKLVVPRLADWITIDLVERRTNQDSSGSAIALATEPLTGERRRALIRAGPDRQIPSEQSTLFSVVPNDVHDAMARDAEQLELITTLGLHSLMVVPIAAGDRVFGTLSLAAGAGRRYDNRDLRLAEELARRAAMALENTALLTESKTAADRTARLQAVTAGLARIMPVDDVADAVVREGITAFEARDGALCLLSDDGRRLTMSHAIGVRAETAAEWCEFSIDDDIPIAEAVRTRQPILLGSKEVVQAKYPVVREANARSHAESWIALPLISNDVVFGGLSFGFAKPKRFDDDDRAFGIALAQQSALALERSRLLTSERVEREKAQRAADRTSRLQTVTAALAGAVSTVDVISAMLEQGIPAVGANAGVIFRLNEDATAIERVWSVGYPETMIEEIRGIALVSAFPTRDVVQTRQPVFIETASAWLERYEPPRQGMSVAPAAAVLPLLVGDRLIGVTALRFPEAQAFTADDRAQILSVVSQCAQAIERARLHEAEREARDTERFLADVGSALAESLDYETTLRRVADLAVPRFADSCIVYVVEEGAIQRVATAAVDARFGDVMAEIDRRHPLSLASDGPMARVIRDGIEIVVLDMKDETLRAMAIDDVHAELLRRIRFGSMVIVPLRVRGTIIGAVLFGTTESGRRFADREIDVARRLADRAALAIDQARLLRAEQHARRDAEDANRSKGQFLATMSHELRTPLNAISGHIQLIELGLHGPVSEPQRAALARVSRAQERLLGLINDILNFARLESGRVEYNIEPVAVNEVVADVVALMDPQFVGHGLVLEVRLENDSAGPILVRADREKLVQVLLNLLSNAEKFTPSGGRVTLDLLTRGDDVGAVLVRVADTGVGIAPDKLQTIFEPFVQLGRSLTSTPPGTGLGLAISRDLARAMGGDLTVESAPGMGSTFTLSLQRA